MKELLKLENVVKVYGGERAVKGVTLALYPGEKALIHGPLRSGKSTLLRLIAGIERPDAGKIVRPASIGVVQEGNGLIPKYGLLENIALPLTLDGDRQADKKARAMMEYLEISYIAGAKPQKVSRVERRLAALARAAMTKPSLLLLDEYTAGFSQRETIHLWNALEQLIQEIPMGIMMFSTQEYMQAFSKKYYMEYGKITEETK